MQIEHCADYGGRRRAAVSECYRLLLTAAFRTHLREKDDIPDTWAVGQKHHQAVAPEARARGRRQTVFQGADVIGIVVHRLLVAGLLGLRLLEEARRLVLGIVQLGEPVGDLLRVDEELEAVGELRVGIAPPRERRYFGGKGGEERGLDKVVFL